ncbi:MAG: MarR family winged helix-turn-helix transcriptional regulator [Alphaproteobacteria bacterium]
MTKTSELFSDAWTLPPSTTLDAMLDKSGGDAEFRKLIYGIFTMTVNFDRIRERMASALGLSGIQYHILMVVAELTSEERVTVSLIADRLHTSGAYVTMESKKLMRRGFLDKRPNPDDGRSVLLYLTDEGQAAIDAFTPHLQKINDELFDGMGPETFARFREIVDHMTRTSTRAAGLAETLAREHTDITDIAAGAVWR